MLARGFLAGKYERIDPIDADSRRFTEERRPKKHFSDAAWTVLEEVHSLANERDATPAQIRPAWLLHKDVVTSLIDPTWSSEEL
ncbi:aldo/keto reductase [Haladaptatus caseinilyticus]|uniref:aldo/keto reductase n=1 Tax=Haladaptatus caseinilyticus TaxID=2993314 RepID=UPI00224B6CBF|nr:aldo/keto reductase [Haladaptatus caseinilyticus]